MDAPYHSNVDPLAPGSNYMKNCCSKGHRAFAPYGARSQECGTPYTSNYPYNTVFPTNTRRMDCWTDETDPALYYQTQLVPFRDSYNYGVVNLAPHSSFQPYLRNLEAWEQERPGQTQREMLRKAVYPPACEPKMC